MLTCNLLYVDMQIDVCQHVTNWMLTYNLVNLLYVNMQLTVY